MRLSLALFILVVLTGRILYAQNTVQKNIVLIIADDFTADPGTRPLLQTPHIDRLRAQGMTFSSAHAAAPLCNPSRTSAFTGIAPWQSRIYTNSAEFRDSDTFGMAVTLPQFFKNKGYISIGTGKIFHRSTGKGSDPISWTVNATEVDVLYESEENKMTPVSGTGGSLPAYVEQVPLAWGQLDKKREEMDDWRNIQQAVSFLKNQLPGDTAFFLACGIVRPHLPHYYPEEYAGFYTSVSLPSHVEPGSGKKDTWDTGSKGNGALDSMLALSDGAEKWKQAVQSYLRAATFADDGVGAVLDAIESLPDAIRNNTLVIFMGDHGYHLGQKSSWAKVGDFPNQLAWEQTTHTPLVVYDPSLPTSHGQTYTKPVSLQDIYPTVLELCGIPPSETPDNDPTSSVKIWGTSLVPVLQNPSKEHDTYALTTLAGGVVSLRTEQWRYISTPGKVQKELYYHGTDSRVAQPDPAEYYNLLHPSRVTPVYRAIAQQLSHQANRIKDGKQ